MRPDQRQRQEITDEAARIVCVELQTDYRIAKTKAAQRLGYPPRTPLPDNAAIQDAVLEYQRLFGGEDYRRLLREMRMTAIGALRLLAPYSPRLVGAVLSGAVTPAHRVQLHAFADQAETIDVHLIDRGIDFEQGERSYRYPGGREIAIPLLSFALGGHAVDVAVFPDVEIRQAPVNPLDGRPFRRVDLAEVERLADAL